MEKVVSLSVLVLIAWMVQTIFTSQYSDDDRAWVDYRSSAIAPLKSQNRAASVICKKPGLACGSDCVSVYLCTETDSGLHPILSETCNSGKTCSAGKCSQIPSHECSSGALFPFVCDSIDGVYPDPADCRRYHYCAPNEFSWNLTHYSSGCSGNYAYNPITTHCDIYLGNQECGEYIVPVCETPAQTGSIVSNSSLYYICLPYQYNTDILYPFLYLCEHGKTYSGKYTCI